MHEMLDSVTQAVNALGRALRGENPEVKPRKIDKFKNKLETSVFYIIKFVKKKKHAEEMER